MNTDAAALPIGASAAAAGLPLGVRMMRAAFWLVGSNVLTQGLRLLSNLLLTRWLAPEAFGLMALINTLYFALVMFSDLGIWQSIVRSEHGDDVRFLGTAWIVQLARAGLLFAVVMGLALALRLDEVRALLVPGSVYADPRLPPMIMVFAFCALVQGAESMKMATALRELRGGDVARLELGAQLVAISTTLLLALSTRSLWALLIGSMTGTLARTLLSHLALPGPRVLPSWGLAHVGSIMGLGKWVFVSSVLGFLAAHGEKIILGSALSTATFGVYSIAAALLAAFTGLVGSLNGQVVFSSLAMAQREGHKALEVVYARLQKTADLLLGVTSGVLATAGQWLVSVLYDPRYHDAGWMLQWLSLGLIAMRHQVSEQLMIASGRVSWVSANNLIRALALLVLIPAAHGLAGERGAVAAIVIAQFAAWPLALRFKKKLGLLNWASERWWIPALASGLLLGALIDTTFSLLTAR